MEAAPPGTRPLDARVAPSGMTAEHVSVRGWLRVASRRTWPRSLTWGFREGSSVRQEGFSPPEPRSVHAQLLSHVAGEEQAARR